MTKKILELAPLATSLVVAAEAAKPLKKKKIGVKEMVGVPVKTIIGAEFIKLQSNAIGDL